MRILAFLSTLLVALQAGAGTPARSLWDESQAKLGRMTGLHQEFDSTHTYMTSRVSQYVFKCQTVLDMSQGRWRERAITAYRTRLFIFDGKDYFAMDEGYDEFVRIQRHPKERIPAPALYSDLIDADWPKAVELERRPCDLPMSGRVCAVVEVPLKPRQETTPWGAPRSVEGSARVVLDCDAGVLVGLLTLKMGADSKGWYRASANYVLKRVSFPAPASAALFRLPSGGMREVKELSWDAKRIAKQMVGKPAPPLAVIDMQGNPVTLSELKGKTVLLNFWATWCPHCRADRPALDELYARYGKRDLRIVGVCVDEKRAIVEPYLKKLPRSFPIVLTTENDMPPPYEVDGLPTYIVIGRDGKVASAVAGEAGYAYLEYMLREAGLGAW